MVVGDIEGTGEGRRVDVTADETSEGIQAP
jgi:hypothetical protein